MPVDAGLPTSVVAVAADLLLALNVAQTLQDLSPLKSVGLHKLKGDRAGQWAMTVNARWQPTEGQP
jgi:plasmid maintenance system killer protein